MNLTSDNFKKNQERKENNFKKNPERKDHQNKVKEEHFTTIDKYFEHPNNDATTEKPEDLDNEVQIEVIYPYEAEYQKPKTPFRNESPKKYVISKQNGEKFLYNRVKDRNSPTGYRYELYSNRKIVPIHLQL